MDVDLLFVESPAALSLTTLRLPSDEVVERLLAAVFAAYEAACGATFPPAWLCFHPSRDRAEG